jgi:hypothetical protein
VPICRLQPRVVEEPQPRRRDSSNLPGITSERPVSSIPSTSSNLPESGVSGVGAGSTGRPDSRTSIARGPLFKSPTYVPGALGSPTSGPSLRNLPLSTAGAGTQVTRFPDLSLSTNLFDWNKFEHPTCIFPYICRRNSVSDATSTVCTTVNVCPSEWPACSPFADFKRFQQAYANETILELL